MLKSVGVWCSCSLYQPLPTYEPHRDKTNEMACAPSEDSDQPGHPPSLIRVFTVRLMGTVAKDHSFLQADSEDSDQISSQADLSLRWAHMPFCWFCHEAVHIILINGGKIVVEFIDNDQRSLLPPFLEFSPLDISSNFSNVTLTTPASTGLASSSPLDFLYCDWGGSRYSLHTLTEKGVGADQRFICSNLGFILK